MTSPAKTGERSRRAAGEFRSLSDAHADIRDFCTRGIHSTPLQPKFLGFLEELILAVRGYTEEGASLMPSIFLTSNLEFAARYLKASETVEIAHGKTDVQGVRSLLKLCAPLSDEHWHIYVELAESTMRYGMLRSSLDEVACGTVRDSAQFNVPIASEHGDAELVRVWCTDTESVSVWNSNGSSHRYDLGFRKVARPSSKARDVENLVQAITKAVDHNARDVIRQYLTRFLNDLVAEPVGFMLGVVDRDWTAGPPISDAVVFKEPIDLARISVPGPNPLHTQKPLHVMDHLSLVQAMTKSDGIGVFDNAGRFRAYRWFVQLAEHRSHRTGGARERAFYSLSEMVDRGVLIAAFIQSREGTTRFVGTNTDGDYAHSARDRMTRVQRIPLDGTTEKDLVI